MKKFSLLVLTSCLISTLTLSANESYTMNFDKETRGLVRKMQVYKSPAWVAKVITKKQKEFFFTSPKSVLEFYYTPKKWAEAEVNGPEDIKNIIVTDYKTGKAIDAKYAFYVYGSNKISFAGDDLPAFKSIDDAKNFMKNNRGRKVLSFSELSKGLIELLNGDI